MLANLVDEYIETKRSSETRDISKFRVSDAGRCHLMRFWKRQGKPFTDEPDARTYRVFEVGHVFHVWLQDLLAEKGLIVGKEFKVEDKHRLGHIDALVMTEQGLVLYDFKTVHSRKFHYMKNGDGDRHYMMQAYTYATLLPLGVTDIRIAYISKDDLCISEVSVDEAIEQNVMDDWNMLLSAWERQEEPEPHPMDWECKYCNYRSSCKYNRKGKEGKQ